jgi:hypothetical protein
LCICTCKQFLAVVISTCLYIIASNYSAVAEIYIVNCLTVRSMKFE